MLVSTIVGRPVGFSAVAGEVVAVERWTETRVGSAGGSVHVHGNNVAVVPPKVWATATARKALWIRTADDEIQVPVPDGMQVRQGHRVHAVIATGVNRGGSQWAAVANHDTNRWAQVGRFPPTGAYDPWTSFVMGFGQGVGNLTVGIMGLYGFCLGMLFLFHGRSGEAFVSGLFLGMGVGFVHAVLGMWQSGVATKQYGKAVKAVCDQVFAAAG